MPHVVLNGLVGIDDIFNKLKAVLIRNESGVLKTDTMYMSRDKSAILIESLSIEGGVKRSFFAMIGRRDDGVVVRIYQGGEVEKTTGVKSILSEIGKQLLAAFPQLTIGETNLSEYLK
ncbi:MAG: hypothetical protein NTX92_06875 [Euryarchaeota archaeon]|jgi:hypothetical protein|nr:hypothetical protein [Euryarchaeota archaeon]